MPVAKSFLIRASTAERLRITATTLDGILTVKGQGRGKGGARHA